MADLFTLSELASYLQRDLDTATATLASALAHGLVRGYTKQTLTQATTTEALVIDRSDLRVFLPQHPVTNVATVVVNGQPLTAGNGWTGYVWDGASWYLQLALSHPVIATWQMQAWPRATVTYTHGYAIPPDELKAVTMAVAGRAYDNPRGLRMESIDDYSRQYSGGNTDTAGLTLLPFEQTILNRFRKRQASLGTW